MRPVVLLALASAALAQHPDPAYEPLSRAYEALRGRDYDSAVAGFLKGIEAAPERASIRKDLAYTYLKIGENEAAKEQFRAAMQMEPGDAQVAMEYAFLCYESKEEAQARRIFDRIRKTGNATAEQAFRNIDEPLAEGIARLKKAVENGGDAFTHFELASLAEQRDDLALAAEHYENAWRLKTERRSVLLDLGRVWQALNRGNDAAAALLSVSRGGEPRDAEKARELLPDRYPYVVEFRRALALDSANTELRRELGYLLLRMDRKAEAEVEFRAIVDSAPGDLLSVTQLGFLLYARGEQAAAMPLFDRVLAGDDEELANRVRAVLRIPQVLKSRPAASATVSLDAKLMAERSIKAGYVKDALKYLQVAHEADPGDFNVMLKLGWTYNLLHQDQLAFRWFDLARKSPDQETAVAAEHAWKNLRGATERFRTSGWFFPIFSTRWHDIFSYAQVKTELRTGAVTPYVSLRFVGDTRVTVGPFAPQYLSESSFIAAAGIRTQWRWATGWFEAGSAIGYLKRHMLPDYRGGVSIARGLGHSLNAESTGWFADTALDGVFVSRFGNDFLIYDQTRAGYTAGSKSLRAQFYWSGNVTVDARRQDWANFVETGPGLRFRQALMPQSMYWNVSLLRGAYLMNRPAFTDLRAGVWYAFSY